LALFKVLKHLPLFIKCLVIICYGSPDQWWENLFLCCSEIFLIVEAFGHFKKIRISSESFAKSGLNWKIGVISSHCRIQQNFSET